MSNDTKMTAGSIEFFRSKNCAEAENLPESITSQYGTYERKLRFCVKYCADVMSNNEMCIFENDEQDFFLRKQQLFHVMILTNVSFYWPE